MNRYKLLISFLLIVLLFSACNNSQNSVVNELELQESDEMSVPEIDTTNVFNLLVANLNLRLNVIEDSIKEVARNQEVLEVLVKDEEDYNSLIDMMQDREETIGQFITESMAKNSSIYRIYFISKDGEVIIDSAKNDSEIVEIRHNDSEGINLKPYLNVNDDIVIFQAELRYMPTGEYIHVVYEVAKEYLLVDVYEAEQSLTDKYCIEVLDVDGTNLLDSIEKDRFKRIHTMMNSYNWEISMLISADE